MSFLDSLDIANRACQHLGIDRIASIDEDGRANLELANAYDKLREAELRRMVWQFSIKIVCLRPLTRTTLLLQPPLWDATATYLPGAIVRDANNDFWNSTMVENRDNEPGQSQAWDQYFGPLTADIYTSAVSYNAGELVYKINGPNDYSVFMSLEGGNTDDPATAAFWDATTVYNGGDVASFSIPPADPVMYRSLIELNTNIQPSDAPQYWDTAVTYLAGATVTGSDYMQYISLSNGNAAFDPVTDGGVHWLAQNIVSAWSASPVIGNTSPKWLRIAGAKLLNARPVYPLGTGPAEQSSTGNVFRLPANYLRVASQNPKNGINPALGGPVGNVSSDWMFQDNYIITHMQGPIFLRFAADVTNVTRMDPLFCEGLAARCAFETCEILTQSTAKRNMLNGIYNRSMGEARMVGAIEEGSEELPLDDWITCRV